MADMFRGRVLWFGIAPSPEMRRELRNRRLAVTILAGAPAADQLVAACGAVFSFDASNIGPGSALARELAPALVDHGLRIEILATGDGVLGRAQKALGEVTRTRDVHARTAPEPHELPERLARHEPGPHPNTRLEIQLAGNREPISDHDIPLFQRAFYDCRKIVLSELGGGRSRARVFSVHATLENSVAGAWPQPFFVKLDSTDRIVKEAENYRSFAPFVPFGLRPSVHGCFLGATRGLLVGDFADKSEPLWDQVRRNVASLAISSLFETTLGGWREQAYAIDPVKGSVAVALEQANFCVPSQIKKSYLEYARTQDVRVTPDQLWTRIGALDQIYRKAPMHGDLHGENVRVRNGNAILIDFASVASGPLTADLAALETWFAFELPPEETRDEYENPKWRTVVDRLYAPASFLHPPDPSDPTSSYCWMVSAVRQIRRLGIAVQSCSSEYEAAVAVSLLRRCMWDDGCTADRFRRAHGYVVASRLIADLQNENGPPS
ncbi:phosphotransferase [Mesorhizobium sp.]|uniref:phosphotransferase n=1 Tax=Mesorhizobium sp. TaxID=1871066 RepID=UPI000FE81ADD|nr:phosphotransferase [Mesorhizobium sp.]RWH78088.1 MAG: hypothetical protein EOQ85_17415 [Mesorhizobium sp.]